jgi:hypothetical protein
MSDKSVNNRQGSQLLVRFKPDEQSLATVKKLESKEFTEQVRKTSAAMTASSISK